MSSSEEESADAIVAKAVAEAAAASASAAAPTNTGGASRKRKESPTKYVGDSYKSFVHACIDKEVATNEVELLKQKLKEAQERDAAADAQMRSSLKELTDHGYEWDRYDTEWVKNYRDLREFQKQNPESALPTSVSKTRLGTWVSRMRSVRRSLHQEEVSYPYLPTDRISLESTCWKTLDSSGERWLDPARHGRIDTKSYLLSKKSLGIATFRNRPHPSHTIHWEFGSQNSETTTG